MAAWHDREFACEAHEMTGTTFLAHVRYATTGELDVVNTHPFLQDGRIFAHNGVVEGLDLLDERLKSLEASELVGGQTDSERVFALITACDPRAGGDVTAGVVEAIGWVADNLPLYAVNILLSTATDLWALRYPDSHELYVLDRRAPAPTHRSSCARDRIHARSEHLRALPSVVFASEPMDDDPGWRLLDPGELVHVDADLNITTDWHFPTRRGICCRVRSSARFEHRLRAAEHQLAADDDPLDLAGALPDSLDTQLAEHPLGDVLAHVAAAAEDLHRPVGHPAGHLRAVQLGHRRLAVQGLAVQAGVDTAGHLVEQAAGGEQFGGAVGEHARHQLVLAERLAVDDPVLARTPSPRRQAAGPRRRSGRRP